MSPCACSQVQLLAQENPEPTGTPTELFTDTPPVTPSELPTSTPTDTLLSTESPATTETVIATETATETSTVAEPATPDPTLTGTPVSTESFLPPTATEALFPAEPPLSLLYTGLFDGSALDLWSVGAGWSFVPSESGQAFQVSGSREPLTFVYENLFNMAASARILLPSGTARISARQSSAGSYAAALDSSGQLTLYRAGVVFQTATTSPVVTGQWRTLRLSVMDDVVRVSVDGIEVIAARDSAMLPQGTVAFAGDGANTLTLDDIQLWVPTGEEPVLPTLTPTTSETLDVETQSGIVAMEASSSCTINVPAADTTALIEAINTANGTVEADTICLENSTYVLTSVNNTSLNGKNGFPLIPSEITIEGNGATITRSGSVLLRFFEVSFFGNLTLRNLTLSNANANEGTISTIYTAGQLTIENSTLTNNFGGAICVTDTGTLTLTNTTVSYTNAGRALQNRGSATITGSSFANNNTGAIYSTSNLNIDASTFTANSTNNGGAIMNDGLLTIANSTFDGNTANLEGGAIIHRAGSTNITGSIFTNNRATDPEFSRGGAIYAHPSGSVTLSDSCIVGNSVTASSGRDCLHEQQLHCRQHYHEYQSRLREHIRRPQQLVGAI